MEQPGIERDPVGTLMHEVTTRSVHMGQLALQVAETVTRQRAHREAAEASAHRAAASDDLDRARMQAANLYVGLQDPRWRRTASPGELMTAWAAADVWSTVDRSASVAKLRAEMEIKTRWPRVMADYNTLLSHGVASSEAMTFALEAAANQAPQDGADALDARTSEQLANAERAAAAYDQDAPPGMVDLLRQVAGDEFTNDLLDEGQAHLVWEQLTEADEVGMDLPMMLNREVHRRDFDDAESMGAVLASRIDLAVRDHRSRAATADAASMTASARALQGLTAPGTKRAVPNRSTTGGTPRRSPRPARTPEQNRDQSRRR